MENTPKPSERLLEQFVPLMEAERYAFRKSGHRFLKPFAHGNYEFTLLFDSRGGSVQVDAAFFAHFDALEKVIKKMGFANYLSAGGTLHSAGAVPWKFYLMDDRFDNMTAKERSAFPSNVVHPPEKIAECCEFLFDAYKKYALPLFERLRTYRDLAELYREGRRAGYGDERTWDTKTAWGDTGRCQPNPDIMIYKSLILGAFLGDDLGEIVEYSKHVASRVPGRTVAETVDTVLDYIRSTDHLKLLT